LLPVGFPVIPFWRRSCLWDSSVRRRGVGGNFTASFSVIRSVVRAEALVSLF